MACHRAALDRVQPDVGTHEREREPELGTDEERREHRRALACVAAFAMGLGATVLALGPGRQGGAATVPAPAPIEYWACDRNGHQVVGLDRDIYVQTVVSLSWPVQVEPRADGGAWIATATGGDPLGAHELVRIDAHGLIAAVGPIGALFDLTHWDGGDALAVELGPAGQERVLRASSDALASVFALVPHARSVAARAARVLLGTADGRLVLLDAAGAELAASSIGGQITDVAPGPADSWWALDASLGGRLLLVDAALAPLWSKALGLTVEHLIPVPAAERVWIADTSEPFARRYGPQGAIELTLAELPLAGLGRGVADAAGGALLAAPGAILRVGARGQLLPGQGGFVYLTDLAQVP